MEGVKKYSLDSYGNQWVCNICQCQPASSGVKMHVHLCQIGYWIMITANLLKIFKEQRKPTISVRYGINMQCGCVARKIDISHLKLGGY